MHIFYILNKISILYFNIIQKSICLSRNFMLPDEAYAWVIWKTQNKNLLENINIHILQIYPAFSYI